MCRLELEKFIVAISTANNRTNAVVIEFCLCPFGSTGQDYTKVGSLSQTTMMSA
jgi:hypothetical protein